MPESGERLLKRHYGPMTDSIKKIIKILFRTLRVDIRRIPEYERNKFMWVKNFNINTIIDIGAHVGRFTLEISRILPDTKIYSFEPIKEVYEESLRKCRNINNFQGFNIALGNFNGNAKIHRNKFLPSSSMLEVGDLHIEAFPFTKKVHDEEIVVRKFDNVVIEEDLQLDPEILIKLDVQGYEDKVIQGGIDTFRKARVIMTEVSYYELYKGQVLFDEIYNQLEKMGFRYKGSINNLFHPIKGLLLSSDAVFVREDRYV